MHTEYQPLGKSVIAMLGAPHSGKSVFVADAYRQALAYPEIGSRVFLQRTCPDGEGMWSAEADQELVKQIRQKGDFNKGTMDFYLNSIEGLRRSKEIIFIDCGGLKSLENILILTKSTDAIILSSNEQKLRDWSNFCEHLDEITAAIKAKDIGRLTEFQKLGWVEIIPENKMDRYSDDEALKSEIARRIGMLYENFHDTVETVPDHKINIIAQLGSRLLTDEQRQAVDQYLAEGKPLPVHLTAHIDRTKEPWQGEMVDLDRNRGNETYKDAIGEITQGLSEINRERLAEFQAQREGKPKLI